MKLIVPPIKPFPNYKWRWAVLTPTESLNNPPIFLGVLRVYSLNQGLSAGAPSVLTGLAQVKNDTKTTVDLVRSGQRNLLRNSGQYWKALGLLEESHGKVILTPFGQALADGNITQVEFATTIVKTLELPNKRIEKDDDWVASGLVIKPLQLILDILGDISSSLTNDQAYLTPFELRRIIIPLAGSKATLPEYANAIIQYRQGTLDLHLFPDCSPEANDKRMSREFLLFLTNYGFCTRQINARGNDYDRFLLANISKQEIVDLSTLNLTTRSLEDILQEIRASNIPSNVEKKRVLREVIDRPYQSLFRKHALMAFRSKCIVTGVDIEMVLEASHIIPVKSNGGYTVDNSLCLRSDIHQLYDSGHLRIFPNGDIKLSPIADTLTNYNSLPKNIAIPSFVNKNFLDWRIKYY